MSADRIMLCYRLLAVAAVAAWIAYGIHADSGDRLATAVIVTVAAAVTRLVAYQRASAA